MIEIIANAKVNLFLEITGKLENGYHTVDTVMQSVSLSDSVSLELLPASSGIVISCNTVGIPCDERNIAHKTARAFLDASGIDCGVSINIEKRIPSEAGMGGGSADGAAVLVGLNHLCGDPLGFEELSAIAASKGADIPFCIKGGTQRLGGIGTDPCETFETPELHLVIAKPMRGISTPAAYGFLDGLYNDFADHEPISPSDLLNALSFGKALPLYNRFEEVLDALCPESKALTEELRDSSHGALLSGSGTAVFAIADSAAHAKKLADIISSNHSKCFVTVAQTRQFGCAIK